MDQQDPITPEELGDMLLESIRQMNNGEGTVVYRPDPDDELPSDDSSNEKPAEAGSFNLFHPRAT